MRRNLTERLIDYLYELDAMDKIQTTWIQAVDDHDLVFFFLVAMINRVRLVGFWQDSKVVLNSETRKGDPEFWIRGHLTVKYQPQIKEKLSVLRKRGLNTNTVDTSIAGGSHSSPHHQRQFEPPK
ncbi:hypothetical protein L915_11331 [Phytophthora nicotianae]|uniref:Uncharacterized protein n=1 Tax=Phytophthora nicotianae TaxID=4792 RepID=W2ITY6_PHYNI|nr:hypothetical protein L915_11331 [Phytophthora nicotianae]ETL36863.1 hypothetical protein L916_11233 [Phytophthora nicotianae]